MKTQCKPIQMEFQGFGRRKVRVAFDGGHISSDGGGVLVKKLPLSGSCFARAL